MFVDYLVARFGPSPEWDVLDAAAAQTLPLPVHVAGSATLQAARDGGALA